MAYRSKAWLLAASAFLLTACGQSDDAAQPRSETGSDEKAATQQAVPESTQVDDMTTKLAAWQQTQQAFLSDYAKGDGVKRSPKGVLYTVLESGDGKSPQSGDIVTVHYEGKLTDGSVFDSSYERGEPASFPSDRLIPGWVEILPMMHVGDKWEIAIPAELAYGSRGAGGRIPPNSTLVFTLELLDFEAKG